MRCLRRQIGQQNSLISFSNVLQSDRVGALLPFGSKPCVRQILYCFPPAELCAVCAVRSDNKIVLYLLVMFYSLIGSVPYCHSAANLALGKSYTVSPLPSYALSAPSTDRTSLTDGKYTVGYFW